MMKVNHSGYCDCCGVELSVEKGLDGKSYHVKSFGNLKVAAEYSNHELYGMYTFEDLCSACSRKIVDFVSEIKNVGGSYD